MATKLEQLFVELQLKTGEFSAEIAARRKELEALATSAGAARNNVGSVGGAFDNLGRNASSSREGLNKAANAVTNLATNIAGLDGATGKLVEGLLLFGAGGAVVTGIAAGFAVIGAAVRFFSRDLAEAQEEAKKAKEELDDVVAAVAGPELRRLRIAELTRERTDVAARLETARAAAPRGADRFGERRGTPAEVLELEARLKAIDDRIAATSLRQTEEELRQAERDLKERERTATERARAAESAADGLRAFQAELRALADQATVSQIDDLTTALERLTERAVEVGAAGTAEFAARQQDLLNQIAAVQAIEASNLEALTTAEAATEEANRLLEIQRALPEESRAYRLLQDQITKVTERQLALLQEQGDVIHGNGAEWLYFGDQVEQATSRTADLQRTITEIGRGIIGAGQAFGVLSDEAAASLQNLLSVADSLPDLLQGGASATSYLAFAGAALGFLSGALGESETERVTRENTLALRDLTERLGTLNASVSGSEFARARLALSAARPRLRGTNGSPIGGDPAEAEAIVRDELARVGLTFADLERIAAEYGLEVARTKDGLLALNAALKQIDFVTFANSLEGIRQQLDAAAELYDRTSPSQQLEDLVRALGSAAGSPAISGALGGLDLSTPEGRAAAERQIQLLFEAFRRNELSPDQFGGLTAQGFLERLVELERLIDTINEQGRQGGQTVGFAVQQTITEASAGQLVSQLLSIALSSAQTAQNTALTVEELRAIRRMLEGLAGGGGGSVAGGGLGAQLAAETAARERALGLVEIG